MAKSITGTISSQSNVTGTIGYRSGQSISTEQIEEVVFDNLVKFCLAPVVLDYDGAVLADGDNAILLNM